MYKPNEQIISAWVNEQPNSVRRAYQSRVLPYLALAAMAIAGCNGGNLQNNNIDQKAGPQGPIAPSKQTDPNSANKDNSKSLDEALDSAGRTALDIVENTADFIGDVGFFFIGFFGAYDN